MNNRIRLADAARALEPCRQGDLDGLCGMYAIINAVRLALHPVRQLNSNELEYIFDAGLRRLQRARQLRAALTGGMFETVWANVCLDIIAATSTITADPLAFVLVPPGAYSGDEQLIRHIKEGIRNGHPVLLGVQGRYDHWTVVARYTRHNLLLFDSSTHHRIAIPSLGIDASGDRSLRVTNGGVALVVRHAGHRALPAPSSVQTSVNA